MIFFFIPYFIIGKYNKLLHVSCTLFNTKYYKVQQRTQYYDTGTFERDWQNNGRKLYIYHTRSRHPLIKKKKKKKKEPYKNRVAQVNFESLMFKNREDKMIMNKINANT